MPQGEHAAQRVADHRHLAEPECVQDVLDQRAGVLAHLPAPQGDRVGQAVAGKVHGEQPDTGQPQDTAALGTDIWAYYAAHPEEGASFARAMSSISAEAAHVQSPAGDLSPRQEAA